MTRIEARRLARSLAGLLGVALAVSVVVAALVLAVEALRGVAVTPRQAAVSALPEDAPEAVVAAAALAVEEDRKHGGGLDARDLGALIKALEFAADWPTKSRLGSDERLLARELLFKLRHMATRAT